VGAEELEIDANARELRVNGTVLRSGGRDRDRRHHR
jgi:hypothetical protein